MPGASEFFDDEAPHFDDDEPEDEWVWVETGPGHSKFVKRNSCTRTTCPVTDGKVLNDAERRSIETLTGIPGVETWHEAKAAVAVTGSRFVEKGEGQDKYRRERQEWMASGATPEERGPLTFLPETMHPERERAARAPGRLRKMYVERLRSKGIPVPPHLRGGK